MVNSGVCSWEELLQGKQNSHVQSIQMAQLSSRCYATLLSARCHDYGCSAIVAANSQPEVSCMSVQEKVDCE